MFIYLVKQTDADLYKIGVSSEPEKRLKSLQTANGALLELINKVSVDFGYKVEKAIHNHFRSKKTMGEWFILTEEDVSNFSTLCEAKENIFKLLVEKNSYIREKGKWF